MASGEPEAPWMCEIRCEADRVWCAAECRRLGASAGLDDRAQWELATAVAELVSNVVRHAGTGTVELSVVDTPRRGVRVVVADQGPGIEDVEAALQASARRAVQRRERPGLGVGLGAVQRMMDEVAIVSAPGRGTRVEAVKYQRR